eukprot:3617869-Alexandrium_andersonii.AAC.1
MDKVGTVARRKGEVERKGPSVLPASAAHPRLGQEGAPRALALLPEGLLGLLPLAQRPLAAELGLR